MEKRYSEMSEYELRQEIASLREQARKAEQLGMVNEFAVLERKAIMASAYMLNPKDFKAGEIYALISEPGTFFKVDYLKGVFAWGYRLNGEGKRGRDPNFLAGAAEINIGIKKFCTNVQLALLNSVVDFHYSRTLHVVPSTPSHRTLGLLTRAVSDGVVAE